MPITSLGPDVFHEQVEVHRHQYGRPERFQAAGDRLRLAVRITARTFSARRRGRRSGHISPLPSMNKSERGRSQGHLGPDVFHRRPAEMLSPDVFHRALQRAAQRPVRARTFPSDGQPKCSTRTFSISPSNCRTAPDPSPNVFHRMASRNVQPGRFPSDRQGPAAPSRSHRPGRCPARRSRFGSGRVRMPGARWYRSDPWRSNRCLAHDSSGYPAALPNPTDSAES